MLTRQNTRVRWLTPSSIDFASKSDAFSSQNVFGVNAAIKQQRKQVLWKCMEWILFHYFSSKEYIICLIFVLNFCFSDWISPNLIIFKLWFSDHLLSTSGDELSSKVRTKDVFVLVWKDVNTIGQELELLLDLTGQKGWSVKCNLNMPFVKLNLKQLKFEK